jgi:hypothetical protein
MRCRADRRFHRRCRRSDALIGVAADFDAASALPPTLMPRQRCRPGAFVGDVADPTPRRHAARVDLLVDLVEEEVCTVGAADHKLGKPVT